MTPDLVADLAAQHDLTDLRQAVRHYLDSIAAYQSAPDIAGMRAAMDTCVAWRFTLDDMTRPPAVRSIPPFEVDE